MILLADVGNTRLKWVTCEHGEFRQRGRASHADNEGWLELAQHQWGDLPPPVRVLIVSVAGIEARTALTQWIKHTWALDAEFVVSAAAGYGIRNSYREPERMGADRWVAMIAARALTQQPCYVVDCGTALTIDALDANGQHQGGVIIPGIRLMREALYRETRQIPPEDGKPALFGQSTRDGVWGGALYAVAAAIDGITERMSALGGIGPRVLTGGDAEIIATRLLGDYRLEPDLIFQGLQVIARQDRR